MTDLPPGYTKWQSDVIVDLLQRYGFDYVALNPAPLTANGSAMYFW